MKKIIPLILVFCLFLVSCTTTNNQNKTITFNHAEILSEQLKLTIPNDWVYEEVCDGDNLIKFYRLEDYTGNYTGIGNVSINYFYDGKSDFYESRKELVPIKNASYKKINENCFIATDKEKGNIICYRLNDAEVINIFVNILAEKRQLEILPKIFLQLKYKIKQTSL